MLVTPGVIIGTWIGGLFASSLDSAALGTTFAVFELLVATSLVLDILNVLHEGFGDPKYRACPLLKKMVAAGHLGRKTGRGFYEYES